GRDPHAQRDRRRQRAAPGGHAAGPAAAGRAVRQLVDHLPDRRAVHARAQRPADTARARRRRAGAAAVDDADRRLARGGRAGHPHRPPERRPAGAAGGEPGGRRHGARGPAPARRLARAAPARPAARGPRGPAPRGRRARAPGGHV
ncbi:MAG: Transcriptional regulator, MarR family, partial [uncultured Solirubrobacteraceae bacterium]